MEGSKDGGVYGWRGLLLEGSLLLMEGSILRRKGS